MATETSVGGGGVRSFTSRFSSILLLEERRWPRDLDDSDDEDEDRDLRRRDQDRLRDLRRLLESDSGDDGVWRERNVDANLRFDLPDRESWRLRL